MAAERSTTGARVCIGLCMPERTRRVALLWRTVG